MNKSAEDYLKFLLDNTSDPVIVFERKTLIITDYNSSAEIFFQNGERNLEKLFSNELITAINSGMRYVYLKHILKKMPDFGGEVCISESNEKYVSGILLIKSNTVNFLRLLSGIKIPILIFDNDGTAVFWNDQAVKEFGYPAADVIGRSAQSIHLLLTKEKSQKKATIKSFSDGIYSFVSKAGRQIYTECLNTTFNNLFHDIAGRICLLKDITSKKHLEDEISILREERDTIFNSIRENIIIHDLNDKIVYANDITAHSAGFNSADDILKRPYSEILELYNLTDENGNKLKPDELPAFRAFKGEKNPSQTIKYKNPITESEEYGIISSNPIYDSNNNIRFSVDVLYNITPLKKTEKELLLSESRFRMLFEQSPFIIEIFNADGELVKFNDSFLRAWNISGKKTLNYNIYKDNSLLNNGFQYYIKKVLEGEFSEIPPLKFTHEFTGENYIWMRGFIYPVKNEDNSIREIVLILENITEQKKIEENFGIEASFRNAIESSISAGIAVVDLNGRQTYVNDAFCKMVEWSKEELTGMYPPFVYWAPENMKEIETAFIQTVNGEAPEKGYELKFRKKNNEIFDALVNINPLKNSEGKTEGWLASVSDISNLKKVENDIKQSLSEKEILLQEIHHRVKNNLQIISSLLNLQLSFIRDKELRSVFKESQNRVMSMALIHQKLYLSRNQLYIDLKDYIDTLIGHLIKSYSIDKDINVDVQVQDVILDNDRVVLLGLIVNELISNSLQYAFQDRKKGSIKVFMKETRSGISLLVKDDGKGFPHNINYKKTNSLGLQLVNSLVEQLGGDIKLRQEEGTEFDISFNTRRRYN